MPPPLIPAAPEIYRPREDGGAFRGYLPADRVVEFSVTRRNSTTAGGWVNDFHKSPPKLFRDANAGAGRGIGLITNPMPRRWYWDWQENALAQLQIKLPIKYWEMSRVLAGARSKAARKNPIITGSNPSTRKASPIPTHTLPRSSETAPFMADVNGNHTSDDEAPLPAAAGTFVHPIKFAEDIDPADLSRTKTRPGCADFIDLMIIRANNGGSYVNFGLGAAKAGLVVPGEAWYFSRVSSEYYTDGVIRRLDESHNRGGQ